MPVMSLKGMVPVATLKILRRVQVTCWRAASKTTTSFRQKRRMKRRKTPSTSSLRALWWSITRYATYRDTQKRKTEIQMLLSRITSSWFVLRTTCLRSLWHETGQNSAELCGFGLSRVTGTVWERVSYLSTDGAWVQLVVGGSTGLCGSRGMEPLRGSIVTGGAAIQSGRTAEKRRCVRRGSTQSGAGGEMRTARRQAAGRGATAGGCGFP